MVDDLFCRGQLTQKLKQEEMSFLLATHCLNKANPHVKFHESIPSYQGHVIQNIKNI